MPFPGLFKRRRPRYYSEQGFRFVVELLYVLYFVPHRSMPCCLAVVVQLGQILAPDVVNGAVHKGLSSLVEAPISASVSLSLSSSLPLVSETSWGPLDSSSQFLSKSSTVPRNSLSVARRSGVLWLPLTALTSACCWTRNSHIDVCPYIAAR